MQFEGVGTIAMSGLLGQIFRKIDNLDGLERAFLRAAVSFSTNGMILLP